MLALGACGGGGGGGEPTVTRRHTTFFYNALGQQFVGSTEYEEVPFSQSDCPGLEPGVTSCEYGYNGLGQVVYERCDLCP
jgi:hypothetical protein